MSINVLDELEIMYDNKPRYTVQAQGRIVDGYYVVDVYRGSDTTSIEGVSWWTTDYCTSKVYAGGHGDKGIIMHRTIRLPIQGGYIVSPNNYLLGGRGTDNMFSTVDKVDLTHYYYGLSYGDMRVDNVPHFDMSIHHTILEGLSTLVGVDKPKHIDVPSNKTITISMG